MKILPLSRGLKVEGLENKAFVEAARCKSPREQSKAEQAPHVQIRRSLHMIEVYSMRTPSNWATWVASRPPWRVGRDLQTEKSVGVEESSRVKDAMKIVVSEKVLKQRSRRLCRTQTWLLMYHRRTRWIISKTEVMNANLGVPSLGIVKGSNRFGIGPRFGAFVELSNADAHWIECLMEVVVAKEKGDEPQILVGLFSGPRPISPAHLFTSPPSLHLFCL